MTPCWPPYPLRYEIFHMFCRFWFLKASLTFANFFLCTMTLWIFIGPVRDFLPIYQDVPQVREADPISTGPEGSPAEVVPIYSALLEDATGFPSSVAPEDHSRVLASAEAVYNPFAVPGDIPRDSPPTGATSCSYTLDPGVIPWFPPRSRPSPTPSWSPSQLSGDSPMPRRFPETPPVPGPSPEVSPLLRPHLFTLVNDAFADPVATFGDPASAEAYPLSPASAEVFPFSTAPGDASDVPSSAEADPYVLTPVEAATGDPASNRAVSYPSAAPEDAPEIFSFPVEAVPIPCPEDVLGVPLSAEAVHFSSAVLGNVLADPASAVSEAVFRDSPSAETISVTTAIVASCSQASLMCILELSLVRMMASYLSAASGVSQCLNAASISPTPLLAIMIWTLPRKVKWTLPRTMWICYQEAQEELWNFITTICFMSFFNCLQIVCDHPVGETLSNAAIKCYFLFSNCIVSNCKLSLVVECDSSTEATINFILCSSLLESPLQPAKILFVYLCVLSYANSLSAILAAILS